MMRLLVKEKLLTHVHFHYACGFYTHTLALMLDSLVRVSRRVADDHYASILAPEGAVLGPRGGVFCSRAITPLRRGHVPGAFVPRRRPMLA